MATLSVKNINKSFGKDVNAVVDFSLDVADGEFVVVVGPSGCGKTTLLRLIAGLDDVDSGDIFIDGERINDLEPKDRNISMVFQNYSLYPTMTVFQNIAFGLQIRKMPSEEIERRVKSVAELLDIAELLTRKPRALSGGQCQRVALGRAIVREPDIFLLDEPLSNLDVSLRGQMRKEIVALHKKLNTTFVYITHDQTEALTMADRVVVMNDGKVQQIGTPTEIYQQPNSVFVATFFCLSTMNILSATVIMQGDEVQFVLGSNSCQKLCFGVLKQKLLREGSHVLLGVRAEDILVVNDGIKATVRRADQFGSESVISVAIDGCEEDVAVKVPFDSKYFGGEIIYLQFNMEMCQVFDAETQKTLICNQ